MMAGSDAIEKPEPRWSRKKKFLVFGMVALLAAIVLGVGLGVGLTRGSNDSDSSDKDSNRQSNSSSNRKLWKPQVEDTWQIVLKDPIALNGDTFKPDVSVYDLDMVENDAKTFQALHDAGIKVICYFSAGSYENWRDDKDEFEDDDMGKPLDGWPGEKWLDLNSANVRRIMRKRIKMASDKGCDAIDPDNVDGYSNDNGLGLTEDDTIDFMQFLSKEARKYNMSTGLKNAAAIIPDVLEYVDFSVNEQCIQYKECELFAPFVDAGKPVFNIEYPKDAQDLSAKDLRHYCSHKGASKGSEGFSTVIKHMNLDGWVLYCDGTEANTKLEK